MTSAIEKLLDCILRCILPLPYCEAEGHVFWRKKSYESWLEAKEQHKLADEGMLHHICYRNGFEHAAKDIAAALAEHLDAHDGKIIKTICKRFELCNSTYDVMYACSEKLPMPFSVASAYVDEWS